MSDYWQKVIDDWDESQKKNKQQEDIAPVKTTTKKTEAKKDERKWFEKGLFEDGYQFGDITKTILGTGEDIKTNLGTGVVGMGEKVVDAFSTLGAVMNRGTMMEAANNELMYNAVTGKKTDGVLERYQGYQDQVEKDTAAFVAKDLYDEEAVARKIVGASLTGQLVRKMGAEDEDSFSVLGEKSDALAQSAGQLAATAALQAAGVPWWLTTGTTTFGSEAENAFNQGATYDEAVLSSAIAAGAEILTEKIFGGISFGGNALDDVLTKELGRAISNKTVRTLAKLGVDMAGEGTEEILSGVMSAIGQKMTYADEKEFNELFSSEEAFESFIGGAVLGGAGSVASAVKGKVNGVDAVTGLTENEQKVVDKVYEAAIAEQEQDGKKLTAKEKRKIYDGVMNDFEKGYITTDTIEEALGGDTYKTYQDTIANEDALRNEFDTLNKMKQGDMTGEQVDRRTELKQQLEELKTNSQRDQLKAQLSDEVFNLAKDTRLAESYNEKARRGQAYEADIAKYDAKQQTIIQKAIDSGILNNTNRTHEFVDLIAKISADKGVSFDFTDNARLKESGFAVDGANVNGYVNGNGDITLNINASKALNSVTGHEITHILEGTELYTELQNTIFEYAKTKGEYDSRLSALTELYKNVEGADVNAELTADLVGDYLFTDADFINNLSTNHRNLFQKIYDEIKYLCKVATAGSKEARELEKVKKAFEDAYRADSKASGDTKYSLTDNSGKELSKGQQDYFKDSKMRDDDGNLMVMYHGSQDAGFHIFDGRYSDDHTSFFFVDRNDVAASYSGTSETYEARTMHTAEDVNNFIAEIGVEGYEVVEQDGKFVLLYEGDNVATSDTAKGIYDEFRWYEGVGEGDANYKVYLNLTNPLIVDGKGRPWNKIDAEFSQEVYDKYNSLTAEEKAALTDLAEWEDFRVFNSEIQEARDNELASAYSKMGEDVNIYDLFSVAADNFSEEAMRENARRYLKTRDYAQRAHEQGYDGVIFKNIVDNGGYSNGSEGASTVAIAFDSKQIKSTANVNPTEDADIRFSLSKPVEESKNLMALHNLTEEKLLKSLELGGLPMPSIAITKASIPHDNFGNITMIFPKNTVDPKANRKNVVYSADAWTPTFPQVEYEADSNVGHRINGKLRELAEKVEDPFKRDLNLLQYAHEDNLNHFGGEDGLVKHAMGKYGLKAAYLEEQGNHIGNITKQVEVDKGFNSANEAKYQAIADILGVSSAEEIGKMPFNEAKENHGEALEAIYPGMTKSVMRMSGVFEQVMAYLTNNDSTPTYKTVTDESAMRKAVDDALDEAGFEAWTRELFAGIVKDKGIYNHKDLFTPSGNRRSFKQTHLPFTLENIVKAMAAQNNGNTKNVAGFNGIKSLRAGTAERFKSIEAMHKSEGRLQHLTQEEADKINDDLQDRLYAIIHAIDDENGAKGESNSFIRFDIIGETLMEISESGKYNVADIQQVFSQYGREVSDATAADFKQLLYDVSQMPVNIYEAKPERAVGFDEVGVFVIPRNADVKLKQELLNRGYSIAEYDPDVEGDRQKVVNQFEEYKFSLSNVGAKPKTYGNYNVYGKDIALAPVQDSVQDSVQDIAPVQETTKPMTADDMISAIQDKEFELRGYDRNAVPYAPATADEAEQMGSDAFRRIRDTDAPPEVEAPYYGESRQERADDPFLNRDWDDRKTKAFITDNPDAKPFFQEAAERLAEDFAYTQPAERGFSDELYYNTNGEQGFYGWSRKAADDINTLIDVYGLSYAQITEGLDAIINDTPKVNNKPAKTIEFILNDRMLKGTKMWYSGEEIPPHQGYIDWLNGQKHAEEYRDIASTITDADAPMDIAPVAESLTVEDVMPIAENIAPVAERYEAIRPKAEKEPRMARATPAEQARADILTEEPTTGKKKSGVWAWAKNNLLDKGMVFEDLSLATGNRRLQARWHAIRNADIKAQRLIGKGNASVKSLNAIREAVERTGNTKQFYEYLYHKHNVDRMTLADRYDNVPNKAVFGDAVTAQESQGIIAELNRKYPDFKQHAQDVYDYMTYLRQMLVDGGVISNETAKLWQEMYPHYVPIRRLGDDGLNINVPLDTGKTGVNAPIKRAKGGNRDILPLFDTMGQRTIQTFKAIAKNRFGTELKNTLGTTIDSGVMGVDEAIDSIDTQDGLLQEGKNGKKPTFTVFENGEKVTFEITEEMYGALKPASEAMAYTNKVANTASNIFRGLTTEYNPTFLITNPIKDVQDVLINSQHPARTYAAIPKAISQMATNGHWYQEYLDNGGENNTYFDKQTNTFEKEKSGISKALGLPLEGISRANNFIEMMPRLAEYIASREAGRDVDVAMLDAARVTTNFAAGGDLTKMLNRNGATFLNASVQGAVQQVRNIREAKANGAKGVLSLAAKFAVAGFTAMVLNRLLWDDDEEYEELSDYVKQNYYIVGKYGDGKFVRIPKGRTVAVIQNAFEQLGNTFNGDEADWLAVGELAMSNLAPNNPLDNNILAPIMQVANNKTWYGEDLVPTRLQDLPAAEQYDESTDEISKWLGEKLNYSPYKINYLLNQYTGGVGDTILPMLTPEAESGDNSLAGNMLAPFKDKFTTDAVMKNQNVSDFYDTVDELTTNAKGSKATDEDVLKYKYMNSVNAELGELYKQKREIQNSDLPDNEKYEAVRETQRQIDEMAADALGSYNGVSVTGDYATVGDRHYHKNDEGEWVKVSDDQLEKQGEVTSGLGITPAEYWGNKDEYDMAYEYPEKYALLRENGLTAADYKELDEEAKNAYTWASKNPEKVSIANAVAGDIVKYRKYTSDLYDIKADKDENGESISGSAKEKKLEYINGLDLDYGQKIILFRSYYDSKDDKATYNRAIVEYLDSRDDISWDEMKTILEELDFTVYDDGRITW